MQQRLWACAQAAVADLGADRMGLRVHQLAGRERRSLPGLRLLDGRRHHPARGCLPRELAHRRERPDRLHPSLGRRLGLQPADGERARLELDGGGREGPTGGSASGGPSNQALLSARLPPRRVRTSRPAGCAKGGRNPVDRDLEPERRQGPLDLHPPLPGRQHGQRALEPARVVPGDRLRGRQGQRPSRRRSGAARMAWAISRA
jgi:hypothetical protein